MAGLGEACTHIAAIMFYVEHVVRNQEDVSVTSMPAYWKPSSTRSVEYAELKNIDFSTPQTKLKNLFDDNKMKKSSLPAIPKLSDNKFQSMLKELHEAKCNSAVLNIVQPFNLSTPQTLNASENNSLFLSDLFNKDCLHKTLEELQKLSLQVVLTMSDSQATAIENETKLQAKSKTWFRYRSGRITASNMKAACCTPTTSPSITVVKAICYPRKQSYISKAVSWGCCHEKDAKRDFFQAATIHHKNLQLVNSGLIINPDYPFLGASPDGLISCDCCGQGCVEVKCPYCIKDFTGKDAFLKCECIETRNGENTLSKKHKYYYQVQTQIFLSKSKYCDFVLWKKNELHIERILPDKNFWTIYFEKAKTFFYKVILPELIGKIFTRSSSGVSKSPHVVFLNNKT